MARSGSALSPGLFEGNFEVKWTNDGGPPMRKNRMGTKSTANGVNIFRNEIATKIYIVKVDEGGTAVLENAEWV